MSLNGKPWQPPFQPMTLQDLVGRLHDADWPETVVLHPIDFMSCAQGVANVQKDLKTGETFFFMATVKVLCKAAKPETLDLSARPTRIVSPLS